MRFFERATSAKKFNQVELPGDRSEQIKLRNLLQEEQ